MSPIEYQHRDTRFLTEIEPQADDFSRGSRLARGVAPTYPSDIIEMPDVSASRIPQGMGQASGLGRAAQVKASGPPVLRTSGELDTSVKEAHKSRFL